MKHRRDSEEWLLPDEFMPFAPAKIGEVKIHHCKLGRGNDRLYIRRKENGDVLAFCFHCSKRGYVRGSSARTLLFPPKRTEGAEPVLTEHGRSEWRTRAYHEKFSAFQGDGTGEIQICRWPADVRAWALTYLSQSRLKELEVFYHKPHDSLVFPIKFPDFKTGLKIGFLERNWFFSKKGGKPKWFAYFPESKHALFLCPVPPPPKVVLCEDYLSGLKIQETGVACALVLFGVSIPKMHEGLGFLKIYDKVLIWLDMDNHQVRKAALRIKNKVDKFHDSCIIMGKDKEPKEYAIEELRRILTDA